MSAKFVLADAGPMITLAVGGALTAAIKTMGGALSSKAVLQECTADPSATGSQPIFEASARPGSEPIPAADLAKLDSACAQGSGSGEIAVLACAAPHGLIAMLDERRARRIAQRRSNSGGGSVALSRRP